jgi:hypothetical protein
LIDRDFGVSWMLFEPIPNTPEPNFRIGAAATSRVDRNTRLGSRLGNAVTSRSLLCRLLCLDYEPAFSRQPKMPFSQPRRKAPEKRLVISES